MPKSKDILSLEIMRTLITETERDIETLGSPRRIRDAKRLKEITNKYEDQIIEISYNLLMDCISLMESLTEEKHEDVIREGTDNLLKLYAGNLHDFVDVTSGIILQEGVNAYTGKCDVCNSVTCPIIRRIKPEQYDEEEVEKRRKGEYKPKVKGLMISGGKIPLPIDIKEIIEKLFSGESLAGPGLKELADQLGISEEELREHIKKNKGETP